MFVSRPAFLVPHFRVVQMTTAKRKKLLVVLLRLWLPAVCLLLLLPAEAMTEQLPVETYTIASGLIHDEVYDITPDSRGFLWFCTGDGLSRFDGYRFTSYGVKDGLSFSRLNMLLESRAGVYWIATNGGGVSRFEPNASNDGSGARKLFAAYPVGNSSVTNRVNSLFEDRAGNIWAATDGGLFRLDGGDIKGSFHRVELNFKSHPEERAEVQELVEDAEGSLWIGTSYGLVRRLPDGRMIHHPIQPEESVDYVNEVLLDKAGRLWLGHQAGLIVLDPAPAADETADDSPAWRVLTKGKTEGAKDVNLSLPSAQGEARWFTVADGMVHDNVQALYQSPDGQMWIGTRGGVSLFDGAHFRNYTAKEGLNNRINAVAEDRDGNLWVGTQSSGAMKIIRNGMISYHESDGLGSADIISLFENHAGELCVISSKWFINIFDGEKFTAVRPNLPQKIVDSSSGRWEMLEDHTGEWWVATSKGLYRFPKVKRYEELARVAPKAVYTKKEGLADDYISRLYEDVRGDIWIGTFNPPEMLTRWERATETFHRYSEKDGLPAENWVNVFKEDAAGNLWIALHNGGLVRYRNGRFEHFGASEGTPRGLGQGLYLDRAHRLWVAASDRGVRVDEPESEHPRFAPYANAENLSSDNLNCFAEDTWGRLYIGTARGVNRLDPETGRIRLYSTSDGLAKSDVRASFRDSKGALWFGTRDGLSRLTPELEPQQSPPPVLISGLHIAGVAQTISELGQQQLSGLELGPNQNQLQIDFFGFEFSDGEGLRYQYKFEGANKDWSAPTDQRTVTASLSPGKYRFLVRAVDASGNASTVPASITFNILPPIWQRWWFLAIAACVIGGIVYTIERYRVARAIELERVRTRIATDLHDDIGSSLSQIAIMSEVVSQRVGKENDKVTEPLSLIAGTSREMVDAMSDIVWAINPKRDHLSDLTQRMRRFASDVLNARDIGFRFRAPASEKDIRLGVDLRREVYLMFKESVNNLVKYSECTEAELEFKIEADWLTIRVSDNGVGFDVEGAANGNHSGMGGHGLASMRRRAEALGGSYLVESEKGKGTTVLLRVPASGRRTKFGGFKSLLPK
jgi:ligand-binding sensor domain-containing protein/signal transduction histidine kinase